MVEHLYNDEKSLKAIIDSICYNNLDSAEISLISLYQLGMNECIRSNHKDPSHKWYNTRILYAHILTKIYPKLIRRIILYYYNCLSPLK